MGSLLALYTLIHLYVPIKENSIIWGCIYIYTYSNLLLYKSALLSAHSRCYIYSCSQLTLACYLVHYWLQEEASQCITSGSCRNFNKYTLYQTMHELGCCSGRPGSPTGVSWREHRMMSPRAEDCVCRGSLNLLWYTYCSEPLSVIP